MAEAVQDPQGSIETAYHRGGLHIQTNRKAFDAENARHGAELEEALSSLESEGLISRIGDNAFRITTEGFRIAKEESSSERYDAATIDKILDLIEEVGRQVKASSSESELRLIDDILERLKARVNDLRGFRRSVLSG